MFGLFNREPVLDEPSIAWLFDLYHWCLQEFDAETFYHKTLLVTPTNQHFPGREQSVHGMATLIFERVKEYAGLSHWPCQLLEQSNCRLDTPPKIAIEGVIRGSKGLPQSHVPATHQLPIQYAAPQVNDPEVLISSLAQSLAFYLSGFAKHPPPGPEGNWPQTIEVMGVFMGFGIMFANTATASRSRGCSSCGSPSAERDTALSQYDLNYALAIFAVLKQIPASKITPHLKGHLRSHFKRAIKDVQQRQSQWHTLLQMEPLQPISNER